MFSYAINKEKISGLLLLLQYICHWGLEHLENGQGVSLAFFSRHSLLENGQFWDTFTVVCQHLWRLALLDWISRYIQWNIVVKTKLKKISDWMFSYAVVFHCIGLHLILTSISSVNGAQRVCDHKIGVQGDNNVVKVNMHFNWYFK